MKGRSKDPARRQFPWSVVGSLGGLALVSLGARLTRRAKAPVVTPPAAAPNVDGADPISQPPPQSTKPPMPLSRAIAIGLGLIASAAFVAWLIYDLTDRPRRDEEEELAILGLAL